MWLKFGTLNFWIEFIITENTESYPNALLSKETEVNPPQTDSDHKLIHIVARGGEKYFFMFSKTLNTNFWKVHRFFGFSKKNIAKSLCSDFV